MWWIRDLIYRPVARLVALALVVVVVGAVLFVTFSSPDTQTTQNAPGVETGPGGLAGQAATADSANDCRTAISAMSAVVRRVPLSTDLQPVDKVEFTSALAVARQDCTFREYANFETAVLLPWNNLVSVDAVFGRQLDNVGVPSE